MRSVAQVTESDVELDDTGGQPVYQGIVLGIRR